jgi:hypothetical protein
MLEFFFSGDHFTHTLAALVLVSRLGDIGSTLLATPTLALEANPMVRRFKKPTLMLGLALALMPYYSAPLGVVVLVPSLFVTGSNFLRGWVAHAVGEAEVLALLYRAARRTSRSKALAFTFGGTAAIALAGFVLLLLSGGSDTWAYWFAYGILMYAVAIGVHGTFFICRIFRQAAQPPLPGAV